MVRAALDATWSCVLANDIDPLKCAVYGRNWGAAGLIPGDVAELDDTPLRQPIDLYWASSPCQDFSLAGAGRGLSGARSGVFSTWIDKITPVVEAGFAPRIIAFENVVGLMTRRGGADFDAVLGALIALGYRVGVMEIDARRFVPQSRPRLFVVAVRDDVEVAHLSAPGPSGPFHTAKVARYHARLPKRMRAQWVWWKHAAPVQTAPTLESVLDAEPDTPWLSKRDVKALRAMMSPTSLAKVQTALDHGGFQVGTLYKRGRPDGAGRTHQRAEVRFDGIAGCLRTPAGGSSRQTLLIADQGALRARLISSREAMRLMGLADSYALPGRYNEAYKVAGDGVVVPVVAYLEAAIFRPVLAASARKAAA